ncbi:hypothetical protein NC797_03925 [Aquibacillus sp. 3ASR75-11]|uniref:Uncharacterized protein n=1 Tax=Terrihalobacillus insolitus TaxID=2950438 RepID=A0A9X4AMN2_9BACI|nr:hypothetical protein [Terrihalobacillus insolitus]MDC3412869.1 hypothetical protein [Terrihalobacillus insolitus]MDC3423655.1 hypothetical protein [Terrihalobacillus insolitus]
MKQNANRSKIQQVLHENLDIHSTRVTFQDTWELVHQKKGKRKYVLPIVLTLVTVFTVAFLIFPTTNGLFQGETGDQTNLASESPPENPIPLVDQEKEKEKLERNGYITDPSTLELENLTDNNRSSPKLTADILYFNTLKDIIFNSDSITKGKVIGIKSFINPENQMAYTKAKIRVVKSYDDKLSKGQMITVINPGAIITKYEQIKKEGIDEKFNISDAELEAAKNKLVVADNYGELMFPDDQVIVFTSARMMPGQSTQEALGISGPVIKYQDQALIMKDGKKQFIEDPFELVKEEIYSSEDLPQFEEKIQFYLAEKNHFPKSLIREKAYRALENENQVKIENWQDALVTYYSKGRYFSGESTPNGSITVTFKTNTDERIIVVLEDESYEILQIIR